MSQVLSSNMIHNQTMFSQNPMFFPFGYQDPNFSMMKSFQLYQMAAQNKMNIMANINNPNTIDSIDDKKSNKSYDKSREHSVDKSVSTIKSQKH